MIRQRMKDLSRFHTFAVCAYKESPYLEECLASLMAQTCRSSVIIATSTPNDHIRRTAERFGVPVFENDVSAGIASDWNFAYRMASTPVVTIAHQDDIYCPEYAGQMYAQIKEARRPLIFFTDYNELRGGRVVTENRLLKVKRIMLTPLKARIFSGSRFVRRRILSFGCPICCPSVAYFKKNLPDTVFETGFKSDLDWQAWEKISRLKGDFMYCSRPLVLHRIHEGSETSAVIGKAGRGSEDVSMLKRFWPGWAAKIIERFYSKGEDSNTL